MLCGTSSRKLTIRVNIWCFWNVPCCRIRTKLHLIISTRKFMFPHCGFQKLVIKGLRFFSRINHTLTWLWGMLSVSLNLSGIPSILIPNTNVYRDVTFSSSLSVTLLMEKRPINYHGNINQKQIWRTLVISMGALTPLLLGF